MFPAPIVMSMSPGRSPSSRVTITRSSDSQNLADSPRAPIRSASSADTLAGSEVTSSRAAKTGAISTSSAAGKLAANSASSARVRETWCGWKAHQMRREPNNSRAVCSVERTAVG
jgi:hypothetical protein